MGEPADAPSYRLAVLKLLLDKTTSTQGPYTLEDVESGTQSRAQLQLQQGVTDVWASMRSRARDEAGIPIPVCLRRGLNGVRLPIALTRRKSELAAIRQLEQARQHSIAQVFSWPDCQVLEANGFKLQRIQKLETMEEMLKLGRFDLFALAADEAHDIVNAMQGVSVLDGWCLAYPSAYIFYVNKQRPELAARLRLGWELVLADGSFAALFEKWAGAQVAKARLAQRRWLKLSNSDLPAQELAAADKRLWHPLVRERLYSQPRPAKPAT